MTISIDSQSHVSSSTSPISVPLTTTKGSGQIVVFIWTEATGITSVTATGLTFTARKPYFAMTSQTFAGAAMYVAPYTSNFSGNISVAFPGGTLLTCIDAIAVAGVDTTSGISSPPFDSNGSLPAVSLTSTAASGTTTNANDFVISSAGASIASPTSSGAWTTMTGSGADFIITMYQIVSSTGTFSPSLATGALSGSIVDAVLADAPMSQIWL